MEDTFPKHNFNEESEMSAISEQNHRLWQEYINRDKSIVPMENRGKYISNVPTIVNNGTTALDQHNDNYLVLPILDVSGKACILFAGYTEDLTYINEVCYFIPLHMPHKGDELLEDFFFAELGERLHFYGLGVYTHKYTISRKQAKSRQRNWYLKQKNSKRVKSRRMTAQKMKKLARKQQKLILASDQKKIVVIQPTKVAIAA